MTVRCDGSYGAVLEALSSSCSAFVVVVQPADLREGDDLAFARRLDLSWLGCILVQAQVRAPSMIIGEIALQQAMQVTLAQNDYMVEAFAAERPDEAFHIWRLPGRTRRNPEFLKAESLGEVLEFQAVKAIAVS